MTQAFKKTLEWELGCINSDNIVFKPHGALLTGQRERYTVVYPFSNFIMSGNLSAIDPFLSFKKDSVWVLCNMRFKSKLRPDLLAISAKGEILIIEAKLRRENGDTNALQRIKRGSEELCEYAILLKDFAKENSDNSYSAWSDRFYNSFAKIFGFPSFYQSVSLSLAISEYENQKKLFQMVNNNIIDEKVLYGLAFNGPRDQQDYFKIDRDNYKEIPKSGIDLPGYDSIQNRDIIEAANDGWKPAFGKLHLFMFDHRKMRLDLVK